jgi:hypothetical protein
MIHVEASLSLLANCPFNLSLRPYTEAFPLFEVAAGKPCSAQLADTALLAVGSSNYKEHAKAEELDVSGRAQCCLAGGGIENKRSTDIGFMF